MANFPFLTSLCVALTPFTPSHLPLPQIAASSHAPLPPRPHLHTNKCRGLTWPSLGPWSDPGFFFFSGGQGLKWRARWDLEGGRGGFGMGGGWSAQACLIPTVWQALSWWMAAVVCIPPAGTISSTKRSKPCTLRLWLEAEVSLHNYTDVCLKVKWYSVEVHLFTFRNRRVFSRQEMDFFFDLWLNFFLYSKYFWISSKANNSEYILWQGQK